MLRFNQDICGLSSAKMVIAVEDGWGPSELGIVFVNFTILKKEYLNVIIIVEIYSLIVYHNYFKFWLRSCR